MDITSREASNKRAFERMCGAEPVLVDVQPAAKVLPGMTSNTILTSGPPLPWTGYHGGQRDAILGAALFEGLAKSRVDAETKLRAGEIEIKGCHDFDCVGSLAGIHTASMPVFVVENKKEGNFGYCNFYEGTNPRRLNYGVYDQDVHDRLLFLQDIVAPVLGEAIRLSGGIPLKPIMQRGLHMGDELHSRNTATSLLFVKELFPHLLHLHSANSDAVEEALKALTEDHYFFLRLSMAAAKCSADAAHGIEGSSIVTAMGFNCKNFAIRVSGLGDEWFLGPHASVEAKLFDGHTEDEITWMGGESPITETIGLGGFAQAAAFPLQRYQGGSAEAMAERNLQMYHITFAENPNFKIPYFGYRGTPTGIDIMSVLQNKILPVMDIGIAGRDGGQIGAGVVKAPAECFESAYAAFRSRYED